VSRWSPYVPTVGLAPVMFDAAQSPVPAQVCEPSEIVRDCLLLPGESREW
jgi:hypothetical protein